MSDFFTPRYLYLNLGESMNNLLIICNFLSIKHSKDSPVLSMGFFFQEKVSEIFTLRVAGF